ncbi:unnamed protein product [Adineta steineri]|uniref:Uncharacterized protein n=1 Tax=Adineta steineri TaxID=433720 RepID=A0A818WM33_9BILA|nr:unnamed protein product [Adineta steineri]CAF3727917.1 unnamed protein product [Adineta steineri]
MNVFVNYLSFQPFEEAENGRPIVLIPVSCFITYDDEFEEKKIEFGQFDTNDNQNYSGQSINQYCKSYMFNIGKNINLRIMDTCGIGDTRGLGQDTKNAEHILSYIINLSYLNAVCFLLKPNTNRPDAPFRACFIQLLGFLEHNATQNIIFCFTNT